MFKNKNYKLAFIHSVASIIIIWLIFTPSLLSHQKEGLIGLTIIIAIHLSKNPKFKKLKRRKNLNKQNDFMKTFLNNCPDLIYKKNSSLNYVGCNRSMLSLLDSNNSNNIIGKTDYNFFSEQVAKRIRTYDKLVMDTGKIVSYKVEKRLSNGKIKIYDSFVAPIKENNEITGLLGIMRDITHTEELKQKIMLQNAQLNAMLDNIPFVLYLKDINGHCINVNRQTLLMIGKEKYEIIGKTSEDIHKEQFKILDSTNIQNLDYIKKQDELVIKNKETITIEQKIFSTKTNKEEWLKIIKSPIFDKDKNVIGIIVVIENISKEKEIESQKETFVATLTHDLKTPTYAQTRAMKLLQEEILGSLNNDQKEMIEQTLNSNLYMTELISTILSTYKSDSGKTVLNKEEFDFCELVNSTCKEISNLAREKRQKIIFQTNIKNKIIADKLQIKRVIINLVSNAISHGFQDSEIKIKLDEDDENISFNVENHSKYLSKETLKEIFEKYKTAPESRFKKTSTGLGLYLSKQIINSHKGKIFADSKENDETCVFGFTIPKIKKDEIKTLNNNSV